MLKKFLVSALLAAGLMGASAASAAPDNFIFGSTPYGAQTLVLNGTTTIQATDTGWLREDGYHSSGNQNYIVGYCDNCGGYYFNDYFRFDLSNVNFAVTSAVLSVGNGTDYHGGVLSTYSLFDVNSPLASLDVDRNTGDSTGISIFDDLQTGNFFGSTSVTSVVQNAQIDTVLNGAALAQINAAAGGQFAIGGTLRPGTTIPGVGGVPEPAAWALMIAGFGLTGAALRRRRVTMIRA